MTTIQELPEAATEKLKESFNWSLSMGYLKDNFKNAVMILMPTAGKDLRKVENYQPISLLEITGEIFEMPINYRITSYKARRNLFSTNQYGFRKGRGTQAIYKTIAFSRRNLQQCNVVCRDTAKPFDKMWKPGLQYKILQISVPDITEKILCNFVEERTATIRFDTVAGQNSQYGAGFYKDQHKALLFAFSTRQTSKLATTTAWGSALPAI